MKKDFDEIYSHLEEYIKHKKKLKGKVPVKTIALELGIEQNNFGAMKNRKKIPYDAILDYCFQEWLNPIEVFYER